MPIWLFGTLSRSGRETWERRIASSASIDDPEAALRKARAALMAILHENMLPFWTERLPEAAGPDPQVLRFNTMRIFATMLMGSVPSVVASRPCAADGAPRVVDRRFCPF